MKILLILCTLNVLLFLRHSFHNTNKYMYIPWIIVIQINYTFICHCFTKIWRCVPNVSAGLTPWLLQKFHFRDSEPLITLIHTLPTLIKAMTL